jgi:outer membrane protein OmpA-like peptidoglycan-associated protein
VTLAAGTLATSASGGATAELAIERTMPVRWIKLVLANGVDVQREQMFLEFSEIIGNGSQEPLGDPRSFAGGWRGRGVAMILRQDDFTVSGCYDRTGDLQGTVTGPILRATGVDRDDGVLSAFLAVVDGSGKMQGVRSTNGAPFRLFEADITNDTTSLTCREPAPPALGCGSIIHGIRFAYDSAEITRDSDEVLAKLYDGLRNEAGSIAIEGHTSSEGTDAYNQGLSERRARAVVAALQARGLAAARLSAVGLGETRPIASNDDESGRSLNRRVEVHCRKP